MAEIFRLIPRPPLDIAAEARFLVRRNGLARQHRVERRAEVLAGDGQPVAGPAVVELAAIDEPAVLVEEEEIRRAGGMIRLGPGVRSS